MLYMAIYQANYLMSVDIDNLQRALRASRDQETCYPGSKDKRTPENPALGQCAVTALIVQDYFGGELVNCLHTHHYRNRLPDGKEIDLTKQQFPE